VATGNAHRKQFVAAGLTADPELPAAVVARACSRHRGSMALPSGPPLLPSWTPSPLCSGARAARHGHHDDATALPSARRSEHAIGLLIRRTSSGGSEGRHPGPLLRGRADGRGLGLSTGSESPHRGSRISGLPAASVARNTIAVLGGGNGPATGAPRSSAHWQAAAGRAVELVRRRALPDEDHDLSRAGDSKLNLRTAAMCPAVLGHRGVSSPRSRCGRAVASPKDRAPGLFTPMWQEVKLEMAAGTAGRRFALIVRGATHRRPGPTARRADRR
jgi:hypothetical protein